MLKIIKTAERAPYREHYQKLEAKYFSNPDFSFDGEAYVGWRQSPFHIINIGLEDDTVRSFGSMIVTPREDYEELVAGKRLEHQLSPYPIGENKPGYLFWLDLIIEEKRHSIYLVRSLFKELENACRTWKINIDTVFAIAYTKVSERLMRRYKFTQVGLYQGKYPIMAAKVVDNIYLKAMIPNIKTDTNTPW